MFKVHLDRRIGESEYRDAGNPCEDFLARLVPEMEARLAAAGRPPG